MLSVRFIYVLAMGAASSVTVPAQGQSAAAQSDEVAALVAQYDSAWNGKDTVAVGRLMAQEYRYFTSRGDVRGRALMLDFLGSPEYRLAYADRSEVEVTRSGPAAVVSSRWKGRGTYRGRRFTDDQRCGQVWLRTARTWQIVSEHCVQIVPDPRTASNSD